MRTPGVEPDPAEVQLWVDAESIARELCAAHRRAAEHRHLNPGGEWDSLPVPEQTCRVAAVAELLGRGVIAAPNPMRLEAT